MKMINTNLLNRFWQKGVQPILDEVGKKLGVSQLVNNGLCNIPGKNPLDAAYGKTLQDQIDEINSKLSELNTGISNTVTSPYLDGSIYFYKVGKFVYFSYLNNIINIPRGKMIEICKVPDGMVPVMDFYTMNCYSGAIQIAIRNSGNILVYNYSHDDITVLTACRFSGAYVCYG